MVSQIINYSKVSQAYKLLSIFGPITKEGSISNEPNLAVLVLNYIRTFKGCTNTELEHYLFHKTKGRRTIQQSNVSTLVSNLTKLGYIKKIKNGKSNSLILGEKYYQVIEALSIHKHVCVYNEKEIIDND